MDNKLPYYVITLSEPIRKALGINIKNKKIYLFTLHNKMYLSTKAVPKNINVKILKAQIGYVTWNVHIPVNYLEYIPTSYRILNCRAPLLELIK